MMAAWVLWISQVGKATRTSVYYKGDTTNESRRQNSPQLLKTPTPRQSYHGDKGALLLRATCRLGYPSPIHRNNGPSLTSLLAPSLVCLRCWCCGSVSEA